MKSSSFSILIFITALAICPPPPPFPPKDKVDERKQLFNKKLDAFNKPQPFNKLIQINFKTKTDLRNLYKPKVEEPINIDQLVDEP